MRDMKTWVSLKKKGLCNRKFEKIKEHKILNQRRISLENDNNLKFFYARLFALSK